MRHEARAFRASEGCSLSVTCDGVHGLWEKWKRRVVTGAQAGPGHNVWKYGMTYGFAAAELEVHRDCPAVVVVVVGILVCIV